MTYCFHCGRLTWGKPLFCNYCGRSFAGKLCPRLHVNPRNAKACSQCGSTELSTPQPKVSGWWHVFGFLVRILLGALLVWLSLVILVPAIEAFLKQPVVQLGMVVLAMLLAGLWFLWSLLPLWLQKIIRRFYERKDRDE